jgi:hypothetical protein
VPVSKASHQHRRARRSAELRLSATSSLLAKFDGEFASNSQTYAGRQKRGDVHSRDRHSLNVGCPITLSASQPFVSDVEQRVAAGLLPRLPFRQSRRHRERRNRKGPLQYQKGPTEGLVN